MRIAKRPLVLGITGLTLVTLLTGAFFAYRVTGTRAATPAQGSVTQVTRSGVSSFASAAAASDASGLTNEFPKGSGSEPVIDLTNRSQAHGHGARPPRNLPAPVVASSTVDGATPGLNASFNGLRMRDQRLANGGNQFSVEPPDQGLCVGNGFVVESVNDVLRVYSPSGTGLIGVTDLNTFYGYPAQFNRTTGAEGPQVTDPSCYYDGNTQRWFQVALTYEVDAGGNPTGANHLDVAVSQSSNPTGLWNIYKIQAADDGSFGQPTHTNCPCLGDYPHIGADANGFYITTNEYPWFANGFNGAQIYAVSKHALASGAASVNVIHLDNLSVGGTPGFTIWPATSPASQYATAQNGSEYFLSSMAAPEANNATGTDNRLGIWTLTNTSSLDSASPAIAWQSRVVAVEAYGIPPLSNQKAGDFPLGQFINAGGLGPVSSPEVISSPDSNDSRMQQVVYANGLLWGALDTVVNVGGQDKAGIAWFVIQPVVTGTGKVVGSTLNQGYIAVANNNVNYPAIAVLPNGKGVMAFTLIGSDYYPSAGYVTLDATNGPSAVHVAAAGLGPDDGFTGYKALVGDPPRTRWGDYGAAVVDGDSIWLASEYIGQTCTLSQALATGFSCGGTRVTFGNWYTRISEVKP